MDEPTNNEPTLFADTGGSNFELKSYDIAPEDAELAAEIESFDPVYDTKGPTSITGAVKLPSSIKATGLPPHLRDPIVAQLANVPESRREAEEARLVNEALYQNSLGVRIACGPGEGANAFQREKFLLTFEIEEAEREAIRLGNALAEVERWDNVFDDATGQAKPVPVEKLQGQQRRAAEVAHRLALHRLDQLNGLEGERRLAKAKFEAVAEVKSLAPSSTRTGKPGPAPTSCYAKSGLPSAPSSTPRASGPPTDAPLPPASPPVPVGFPTGVPRRPLRPQQCRLCRTP